MKPIVKNILAVLAGVISGGFLNMGIIMISRFIIPPPEGADLTTLEGLKASMHLMEPKHYLMPLLAHALGTLLAALIGAALAASHKMRLALGISAWFMLGGLINVFMLPAPMWFNLLDLTVAYIPMGYLAGKWMSRQKADAPGQ